MPSLPSLNEKAAARTNRGDLDFVFSTTHPLRKEQADVSIYDASARV